MSFTPGLLLRQIDEPADLRRLPLNQLPQVCEELRQYIIDVISVIGGHFGASLGAVELTVALHYVYQTPYDLLVWDVGHQAYGHKILTGRRDRFPTNRQYGGLSGFPKRGESPYDTFGVGHASTSISAALGMAIARDRKGERDRKVVAVIGDGGLTGGMAFEALNNAGALKTDLLVVLNDNQMSIDPNVGALKEYLAELAATKTFNRIRDEIWKWLGHLKGLGEQLRHVAARLEDALVAAFTPGMFFEALGFRYFGPIDGHDVFRLVRVLEDLRALPGPKLLHVVTVKGKGFGPAERDQVKWHAQGHPFDKITGQPLKGADAPKAPNWQDVFGRALVELAQSDERVLAITAAMPTGTSVRLLMEAMPDRAFDVGIAEQHAVTFAAGLATQGFRPFVAIYSTFLQRAYDQIIHDVCLQQLPVIFCMDRAGLVGADGPTHHGAFDIAYLRCIPNLVVAAPMDEQDLRDLLYTALHHEGPFAIRYPRGPATGMPLRPGFARIPIGRGRKLADGTDLALLSYGHIGTHAMRARQLLQERGISAACYDMRFVKPLDTALIDEAAERYPVLVTIEDGVLMGGFGSAVLEYLAERGYSGHVLRLGLPDRFVEHGSPAELYAEVGLDPAGIAARVEAFWRVRAHSSEHAPVGSGSGYS
ncbi:MAG: 1-deoxy-D-xylulose-5-phosphate synthase [Bacteroidetes bacterium]|nr:1-deoxy-D-xylulose-5-phosphate synthase [Bacteroidota bacterium]MCX7907122.1 1-deoxy-D-xylulose-5-phosphate synthase [Bacteroidota bacterium]